jgi:serpin B
MQILALFVMMNHLSASPSFQSSSGKFAVDFWRHEVSDRLGILISPYSFYQALSLLTVQVLPDFREAFFRTLGISDTNLSVENFSAGVRELSSGLVSAGDFVLHNVNAIWINSHANIPEIRFDVAKTQLSATVSTVRFPNPAKDIINEHIKEATNGMMRDCVQEASLDGNAAAILTNVLYLHGRWVKRFEPERTKELPFRLFSGEKINVSMMHGDFLAGYDRNDHARLVHLPYKDSNCEFLLIVPHNETEDGLRNTMLAFDPGWLNRSIDYRVILTWPKFKFRSSGISLMKTAAELGLKDVLGSEERIFPQPEGEKSLVISEILQDTLIEVDEQGTKAAAVTHIHVGRESALRRPDPINIKVDHPFGYVIYNRATGTILFMGTCLNPNEEISSQ